jgi:hypothetical protein
MDPFGCWTRPGSGEFFAAGLAILIFTVGRDYLFLAAGFDREVLVAGLDHLLLAT